MTQTNSKKELAGFKTKEMKAEVDKQAKEIQKKIQNLSLEDLLDEEQVKLYEGASRQRRLWLDWFVRTGDSMKAGEMAYPNMQPHSLRVVGFRNRQYFKISTADLFRAIGIDELRIANTVDQLLNAKRTRKTFIKGELKEEVEEEDNFALGKGLDYAVKLTGNESTKKLLVGEDKDNPMTSLTAGLKSILNSGPVKQISEEPPE